MYLSGKDNQKLSKLLKKGSERSVFYNECEIERGNKDTENEYRYFLESKFVRVNR